MYQIIAKQTTDSVTVNVVFSLFVCLFVRFLVGMTLFKMLCYSRHSVSGVALLNMQFVASRHIG